MIKWFAFLILVTGLGLVACIGTASEDTLLTPNTGLASNAAIQEEPPATVSNLTTIVASRISIKTDRELYKQGESIQVRIENNSASPIQFMDQCSLNQCYKTGTDWICTERECDGPVIVLEPGRQLEIVAEANVFTPNPADETISSFKLDYQVVSENPFYFARSNEFSVQSTGVSCKQARQIAIEHAQSTNYWEKLDLNRATVKWQGENRTCIVDFAWRSAGQIRAGLWAEGYYVVLDAKSGRVIEANAYER